jgi:hypothetical protein
MDWLNTISNLIIASSCLMIGSTLVYLAIKYRSKRLVVVFSAFAFIFLAGVPSNVIGAMAVKVSTGYAVFRGVLSIACMMGAYVAGKCYRNIYFAFAKMAAWERRLTDRVAELNKRNGASDTEFVGTLTEVRDAMRSFLEVGS